MVILNEIKANDLVNHMAQDRIQLRGHHIGTFAVHYWGDDFYRPKYDEAIFGKRLLEEKIVDKHNILDKVGLSSQPEDGLKALYGKRMVGLVDTLYAVLQMRPDLEVEIVEGLDSVCMAGCPKLQSSCAESSFDDEDRLALETYGLEVGKTYTAGEIVQRVRDFTIRTGIRSPRDIQLARMGRVDALLR